METIRASALNMAWKCPGYPHLLNRTKPDNEAMAIGRRKHEIIAANGNLIMDNDERVWWNNFSDWWRVVVPISFGSGKTELFGEIVDGEIKITGHADWVVDQTIVDWKAGSCFSLPPIMGDLQMLAYAAMFNCKNILRVQIDNYIIERFEMSDDNLKTGHDFVIAIARRSIANPRQFSVGHHCQYCLCNKNCKTYLKQSHALINTKYVGGALTSKEQAIEYLLASAAVKKLLEIGDEEVKKFVRANGPIEHDGKKYGPSEFVRHENLNISEKNFRELLTEFCEPDPLIDFLKTKEKFLEKNCERWAWRLG